jgi:hypothetical protein
MSAFTSRSNLTISWLQIRTWTSWEAAILGTPTTDRGGTQASARMRNPQTTPPVVPVGKVRAKLQYACVNSSAPLPPARLLSESCGAAAEHKEEEKKRHNAV